GPIGVSFSFDEPVVLAAGDMVPITLSLLEGPAITIRSAVVANEHWDDPLPLRMGGRDAFWNWYQGLSSSPTGQMNNYDEDTVQKRFSLLAWLSEADYIVLSSNRLYASIPRLSQRYPLTTEYYRRLLDGSLGFELAATFVSYPRLGPCQFPDQEIPFSLMAPAYSDAAPCSIALPPAEEAFSVYDHPTVLIFRKTPAFNVATAELLLPRNLINEARWMTPREATEARPADENALLMSTRRRAAQKAGGTWSKLFNTDALQNRSQRVAIVLWALLVTLLGWIAFPLIYRAFPALRCHGYGLARTIGVLLWAYLAWLLASLHILPYTRLVLWSLVVLLAGISAWTAWRRRDELKALVTAQWRTIVLIDTIFFVLFLFWVGVRWMNPDLWHPVTGGEKPMDFAYYNAVIRSTWFPPYDPWFAGGQLNYYYFGFVIIGSLTKALGIVPSVAYNLAIPTLFALTGVGGFVLASNLAGGDARRWRRAGLWGVIAVVILGNLGEVRLIVKGLAEVGGVTFESMIPHYPEAVSALVGLWRVLMEGVPLPFRPEWWYWDPTRIIPVAPGEVGPINEFPAFTFLYADLHAHAMALPLTQVALALAIQWALGTARSAAARTTAPQAGFPGWRAIRAWALPRPAGSLLLAGLVAGALRATNTWDYPTYLALMTVGFLIGLLAPQHWSKVLPVAEANGRSHWDRRVLLGLATPALLLGCAELLFRPFTATYEVPYAAFELWPGSRTPLDIYFLMYGPFLFPIAVGAVTGLVRPGRQQVARLRDAGDPTESGAAEHEAFAVRGSGAAPSGTGASRASSQGQASANRRIEHALWLVVVLLIAAVLLVLLAGYFEAPVAWLAVGLGLTAAGLVIAPNVPLRHRLLWFWVGTALALSLLVEVAVLKGDIGRMNTVFKFHLQIWMLLAASGAVFIERLLHGTDALGDLLDPCADSDPPGVTDLAHDAEDASAERPHDGAGVPGAALPRPSGRPLTIANDAVAIITAILIFGAALYPVFAIPAKIRDRWEPGAPHTLDGMAFLKTAVQYEKSAEIRTEADYRVIRWLQENVEGSPTIIEGLGEREYLWGNRISIYTGLPAVVGWRWHQVQQRMVLPAGTVEGRQQDVRLFYNTTSADVAHAILEKYQVAYVILGPYERAYTLPDGLPKFDEMVSLGWLEVAYEDDASTVYQVVG
ncbi:MAG: hypothetical protein JXC32_02260, partial [Anaerolineae bacterium]|nr:hypothetical protein [Anaerolineae bacterium]